MQVVAAELTVDLPWLEPAGGDLDGLRVRRGRVDTLAYDDGIVLDVEVIEPTHHPSPAALVDAAKSASGPGRVVLVAGAVPLAWRGALREAGVSFVDVSGVAEIHWPRIDVSERRFGKPVRRKRAALPFQKGHALVVQELLILTADGTRPTISEVAESAGVSLPSASKAISQLEEHGLVAKQRDGARVMVEVLDRVAISVRLAERTSWPGEETIAAYLWGRTVFDVAARLSAAADEADTEVAVTGRTGAAHYGVLGTSSPKEVRCWIAAGDALLADVADRLGLEPAPREEANLVLSADRWKVGVHRRRELSLDEAHAWVAHPLRVWCDLHDEERGAEFAAQMWGAVSDG